MADYIHLIGADDVKSAGHTISHAADTMRSAAGSLDDTMRQSGFRMDDHVMRIERAAETIVTAMDRLSAALEATQPMKPI